MPSRHCLLRSEARCADSGGEGPAAHCGQKLLDARRNPLKIKQLIPESVGRVEHGTALVDKAGHTMTELVASIRNVCPPHGGDQCCQL